MTPQKILSCRFRYTNMPILYVSLTILLPIYLGESINCGLHIGNDVKVFSFFLAWVAIGLVIVTLLPIVFSIVISTFLFNTEGIVEHRGYFWGLIKNKKVTMSWSGFESWDINFVYSPMTKESFPQTNLYCKPKGVFRFNQKSADKFLCNDRTVKWSTFSKHLIELFNEVNLPHLTPNKEKSMRSLMQNLIIGAAVLIFFLIIVAGVLSIIAGKINWYSVVVVAGFLSIVVSVLSSKRK